MTSAHTRTSLNVGVITSILHIGTRVFLVFRLRFTFFYSWRLLRYILCKEFVHIILTDINTKISSTRQHIINGKRVQLRKRIFTLFTVQKWQQRVANTTLPTLYTRPTAPTHMFRTWNKRIGVVNEWKPTRRAIHINKLKTIRKSQNCQQCTFTNTSTRLYPRLGVWQSNENMLLTLHGVHSFKVVFVFAFVYGYLFPFPVNLRIDLF